MMSIVASLLFSLITAAHSETWVSADHLNTTCSLSFTNRGGLIEITGFVRGLPGKTGTYTMSMRRDENGNVSLSRQSGTYILDPEGRADLSQVLVSDVATGSLEVIVEGREDASNAFFDCEGRL